MSAPEISGRRVIELVMAKYGCTETDAVKRINGWVEQGRLHWQDDLTRDYDDDDHRTGICVEGGPIAALEFLVANTNYEALVMARNVAPRKELVALGLLQKAGKKQQYDRALIVRAAREIVQQQGRPKSKAKLHEALVKAGVAVPALVQFRKIIASYWDE